MRVQTHPQSRILEFLLRGCLEDCLIEHSHPLPHRDFWSIPFRDTSLMDYCGSREAHA